MRSVSKSVDKSKDLNASFGRGISAERGAFIYSKASQEFNREGLLDPIILEKKILEACRNMNIKVEEISRLHLITISAQIGFKITYAEATEAILQCRGIEMEKSNGIKLESLIGWFFDHLDIIRLRSPHKKSLSQKVTFMTRKSQAHPSDLNSLADMSIGSVGGGRSPMNETRRSLGSDGGMSTARPDELKRLRQDEKFKCVLDEAISHIITLPKLRHKVKQELASLNEETSNLKVLSNAIAAKDARKRLFDKKKREEQKYENGLSDLIERTTKEMTSARANNLKLMLSKKWSEHKNAYRIVTNLTNRSQERINQMVDNRYN